LVNWNPALRYAARQFGERPRGEAETANVTADRGQCKIGAEGKYAGRIHCGEFACQSGQSRQFHANLANHANWKINKLRGISGLRSSESLFLRHYIPNLRPLLIWARRTFRINRSDTGVRRSRSAGSARTKNILAEAAARPEERLLERLSVLQCRNMRTLAASLVMTFTSLSIGCDVILQPPQQGEWSDSNFRNPKYKVTKDIRDAAEEEKPPADK